MKYTLEVNGDERIRTAKLKDILESKYLSGFIILPTKVYRIDNKNNLTDITEICMLLILYGRNIDDLKEERNDIYVRLSKIEKRLWIR